MKRRLFDWLSTVLERLLLLVDQRAPTLARLGTVAKPKASITPLPYHACLIPWQWLSRDGTSWQCPVCGALYSYLPTPRPAYVTEPEHHVFAYHKHGRFQAGELARGFRTGEIVIRDGRPCYADNTPIHTGQLYRPGRTEWIS